jgi:hypothetical protein
VGLGVDGRVGEEWKSVKLVSIMRASREEKDGRVWEPLMQRGRRSRSANARARVHREPCTRADVKTYVQCTWRSIPSLSDAPSIPFSFGNLPNHHPIPILRASIDRHFQPSDVLPSGPVFGLLVAPPLLPGSEAVKLRIGPATMEEGEDVEDWERFRWV